MAVEFPNGEGRPREELERFIASLHEFLWEILKKYRELLEPEFIQEAERALEETSNHFNHARRAIAETSDAALASHGLTGAVLRFKLRIVRWLMDRFYRNPSGGPLVRVLEFIDDVLASILDAAGAGGAIAEIKDAIKAIIQREA